MLVLPAEVDFVAFALLDGLLQGLLELGLVFLVDVGRELLEAFTEELQDVADVDQAPRMEGRFMSMILVPNREAIAEARRAEEQEAESEAAVSEPTTEGAAAKPAESSEGE